MFIPLAVLVRAEFVNAIHTQTKQWNVKTQFLYNTKKIRSTVEKRPKLRVTCYDKITSLKKAKKNWQAYSLAPYV